MRTFAELTMTLGQLLIAPILWCYALLALPLCVILDDVRGRKLPAVPKVILITGAGSGLGEGLALKYARPGITLALTGRNKERVGAVAAACEAKGATCVQGFIDVTDQAAMEDFILDVDDATPIDLVVANAGVSELTAGLSRETYVEGVRLLQDINVTGVFNTILPLIPRMKARSAGQIAIMSSLSGTSGMSNMVAYAATKTGIRAWGEGLRGELYHSGIFVNVLCPGYVRTPMSDAARRWGNTSFQWDLEPAIELMVDALRKDTAVLHFPWFISSVIWSLGAFLPTAVKHDLGRLGLIPRAFGFGYMLPPKRRLQAAVKRVLLQKSVVRKFEASQQGNGDSQ